MKFSIEPVPTFQPLTIVIESAHEASVLRSALAVYRSYCIDRTGKYEAGNTLDPLHAAIKQHLD